MHLLCDLKLKIDLSNGLNFDQDFVGIWRICRIVLELYGKNDKMSKLVWFLLNLQGECDIIFTYNSLTKIDNKENRKWTKLKLR